MQASSLTVAQGDAAGETTAKHVLGCLLAFLQSCRRVSVGQPVTRIILDGDLKGREAQSVDAQRYIELSILGNKTARSDQLKRAFSLMVAPIFFMSCASWLHAWVQAREVLGLETTGALSRFFFNRCSADGVQLEQNKPSSEVGKFLRVVLGAHTDEKRTIRSHLLKVTLLSWAGMYGVPLFLRRL